MTASPGNAGAEATAAVLRRVHDSYRELVTGLDDAAVNYKPGKDTNSIYQMMHHALDVERMWISMAANTPIPGRPEPWLFVGPAADLIPRLDEAEQDIQRFLESADLPDPGEERTFRNITQSVAMCWTRAVRHLSEHLGHIGLTRQMWEQFGSPEAGGRGASE